MFEGEFGKVIKFEGQFWIFPILDQLVLTFAIKFFMCQEQLPPITEA